MEMEIKYGDLQKFTDPEYWIKYFSENAKNDLKDFGMCINFDRSFYTSKRTHIMIFLLSGTLII